jgi:site-specific DNA recombinase
MRLDARSQARGTFARDQVRAVAQRVEVVSRKEVRIRGLRSEPLLTLTAASGVEAAGLGVCAFEAKWRARRDSNPRPPDSKSGVAVLNRI